MYISHSMRRKIPSLQALACFEAAARHESYTRAAQELALTQGAVSRQITALEEFLGQNLFRRTRHGVALTERGRDYATQITPRLQALEQDTLDAMATHGSGGTLHLGAVPTFATRWLIPRLPQFHAAHPDITVHIDTRTRPFLFADSGFDAALFAGTPEQIAAWAGTQATRLMPEVVLPVCSPAMLQGASALSPADIAALPLLQQSTRPNAWREWFEASGAPFDAALAGARFEQFSMTAAAAACGMGVALVPRLLIDGELARGELVVACDLPLPEDRAVYLIQPQRDDARPALGVFAQWLQTSATQAPNAPPVP